MRMRRSSGLFWQIYGTRASGLPKRVIHGAMIGVPSNNSACPDGEMVFSAATNTGVVCLKRAITSRSVM
ncbi:MAG: hypothetical protein BWY76_01573 [bacterium ADurb.Bin429]|nr:MAG: hypothetical protein BWY76_01573 [bacterium ADurb.Bin429]